MLQQITFFTNNVKCHKKRELDVSVTINFETILKDVPLESYYLLFSYENRVREPKIVGYREYGEN